MGGGPEYPYPKWVYTPSGWWPKPKNWKPTGALVVMSGISLMAALGVYADSHQRIYDQKSTLPGAGRWKERGVDPGFSEK